MKVKRRFPLYLVMKRVFAAFLMCLSLAASGRAAVPAQSLDAYLAEISSAFQDRDKFRAIAGHTIFDDLDPEMRRFFGRPKVISLDRDGRGATVLLSATVEHDNSGDQTIFSSSWSGLYRVTRSGAGWQLGQRIGFGVNRLASHKMVVDIDPNAGLKVHDEMEIEVGSGNGFPMLLNRNARIEAILAGRQSPPLDFQNGLLWIGLPKGFHRITIDYTIQVETAETGNSASFGPDNGYVRNQYFWHPSLGFGEDRGRASFTVRAAIPSQYQLALDIPQTERLVDGKRVVEAVSAVPAETLTMAYDKDWQSTEMHADGVVLTLLAAKGFTPAADVVSKSFSKAVHVLTARFGRPPISQIKIIQLRRRRGNGWHFFSNQAIFTGASGGSPVREASYPIRVFLGHEVAHLWTKPTGWSRNFLSEGWATYAESIILKDEFGPETVRQFWRDEARLFLTSDGPLGMPMREDRLNGGVSYWKGAWALRMLERLVGDDAFSRAVVNYVAKPVGRTSYDDFLASFGSKRSMAERFMAPWVSEPGVPTFDVVLNGGRLTISQKGAIYWLPHMAMRLVHPDGSSDLIVTEIEAARTSIDLPEAAVSRVELDPFEDYLLGQRLFDVQ
jgi:hypothetical protein